MKIFVYIKDIWLYPLANKCRRFLERWLWGRSARSVHRSEMLANMLKDYNDRKNAIEEGWEEVHTHAGVSANRYFAVSEKEENLQEQTFLEAIEIDRNSGPAYSKLVDLFVQNKNMSRPIFAWRKQSVQEVCPKVCSLCYERWRKSWAHFPTNRCIDQIPWTPIHSCCTFCQQIKRLPICCPLSEESLSVLCPDYPIDDRFHITYTVYLRLYRFLQNSSESISSS